MGTSVDGKESTEQLLRVKASLGLSEVPAREEADDSQAAAVPKATCCINCGYQQEGQLVDRCPECGLNWASRLRDSAPWCEDGPTLHNALVTALRVCTWNPRLSARTAMIPSTPGSRSFAHICTGVTSILIALQTAPRAVPSRLSWADQFVAFIVNVLLHTAVICGLLLASLFLLRFVLKTVWRRRLAFIPSCVDYSCAWWPPAAMVSLSLYLMGLQNPRSIFDEVAPFATAFVIIAWALWLWSSVLESGYVEWAGLRILVTIACCGLISLSSFQFISNAVKFSISATVVQSTATVAKLKSMVLKRTPRVIPPKTYALVIDAINGVDDAEVAQGIRLLGAAPEDTTTLKNEHCTIKETEDAFANLRVQVRREDRVIIYINGHGAEFGAGSIALSDGPLTAQRLRAMLLGVGTNNMFILIDSCFGGKFVTALDGACNAQIMTTTDDRNVSFSTGLRPFWRSLRTPAADADKNGKITIKEAYNHAFAGIIAAGERARKNLMISPMNRQLMESSGYQTPELETPGTGNPNAFEVPVETQPSSN